MRDSMPRPRAVQGLFRSCAELLIVASSSNTALEVRSSSCIDSLAVQVVASRLQLPLVDILISDDDCCAVLRISKDMITTHMKILLMRYMDCDSTRMRLKLIVEMLIAKLMKSATRLQPFTDS